MTTRRLRVVNASVERNCAAGVVAPAGEGTPHVSPVSVLSLPHSPAYIIWVASTVRILSTVDG